MSANSLLLWMSARGEGSWQQYRAAVEELHLRADGGEEKQLEDFTEDSGLPLYHLLRLNLQRLGHAEFGSGAGGSDWKVTPPTLAVTEQSSGWLGVVAGARSPKTIERLQQAASSVTLDMISASACPDQILLHSRESSTLVAIAEKASLHLQKDAATAILMSLPPVDDRSTWRQIEVPIGVDWRIERFSTADLGWRASTRNDLAGCHFGLFRLILQFRRHVLLCAKGGIFEVPAQVGKYILLRRAARRTISYSSELRQMSVPASCRPPFLVERALISCSGVLPSYAANSGAVGMLHYGNITFDVAQLAAAVLRQDL